MGANRIYAVGLVIPDKIPNSDNSDIVHIDYIGNKDTNTGKSDTQGF